MVSTFKLYNPYVDMQLNTIIQVPPYCFDEYFTKHVINKLKTTQEGICVKNIGYINRIYDDKVNYDKKCIKIERQNRTSNAILYVEYIANVCKPINDQYVLAKVFKLDLSKISVAINGPLKFIIERNVISKNFMIENESTSSLIHVKTKHQIVKDDILVIKILKHLIASNDKHIMCFGTLEDYISDPNEYEDFLPHENNGNKFEKPIKKGEDDEIPYFNDDENMDIKHNKIKNI